MSSKTHGAHIKTKAIYEEGKRQLYEGHEVFQIKEIIKDGENIINYRNYRVGSKIYKDFNDKCPKGHFTVEVIEY